MLLRTKKNRRKVSLASKAAAVKASARANSGWVLKVLIAMAVVVAAGFGMQQGLLWAQQSQKFAISKIHFTGLSKATEDELSRIAGLSLGQNLVKLDAFAAERAIAAHPWVKSVTVRRHLPAAVEIAIVEHQAVAMVSLADLYLLDKEGNPFKRLQPGDDLNLPLVTGVDRDDYVAHPDECRARLVRGLEAAAQYDLTAKSADQHLSELRAGVDGVAIITNGGQEIRLGDGDVTLKLQHLARVRSELQSRSLTAELIRLDNRTRPDWVTVQLSPRGPERGSKATK